MKKKLASSSFDFNVIIFMFSFEKLEKFCSKFKFNLKKNIL